MIRKGHVGSIYYTPTEKRLADLGTKFLTKQRHRFLIELTNNFQELIGGRSIKHVNVERSFLTIARMGS